MKSIAFTLTLLCLVLTNHLSAQYLIYPDTIPVHTIRVPLPYLKGGTVQNYITDLQYFPLESKETADIISRVADIAINSDRVVLHFHVFSKKTVNTFVCIYDTAGRLKHKLSTIDDFQSSSLNEIKPWRRGFLARSIHAAIELDTAGHWNKTLNPINDMGDSLCIDNSTWYYRSFRKRDSGLPKIGLYLDTVPHIQYSSQTKPTLIADLNRPLSPYFEQANAAYSTFPFSTEIFELSDNGIRQIYKFILPLNYTLDTAEHRLVKNEEEKKVFISKYPNAVNGFDNVIHYKNYLLFQLKYLTGKTQWIALDTDTEQMIDLDGLLPDRSSDYMPIIGWQKFLRTDGEYLYSILYPNEVVDRWGEKENRLITERVKLLSKSKNPVLVRFKLK